MLARHILKPGTGSPIVFLHGFLGTSADWAAVVQHLPAPCIAFDLPGHGASPFTLQWEQTLTREEPFHLVGYSLGGRLALRYAQTHSVLSLTLISAHLGLPSDSERQARATEERLWLNKLGTLPIDEFVRQWYDQPLFKTLSKDVCKMRTQNQNQVQLAHALQAFALSKQPCYPLPSNSKLICGEHDTTYRNHYAKYPHTVIPDAGHAVHLENPEELHRHLVP